MLTLQHAIMGKLYLGIYSFHKMLGIFVRRVFCSGTSMETSREISRRGDKSRRTLKGFRETTEGSRQTLPTLTFTTHPFHCDVETHSRCTSVHLTSYQTCRRMLKVTFCHCFCLIKTQKLPSRTEGKWACVSMLCNSEMRMHSVGRVRGTDVGN